MSAFIRFDGVVKRFGARTVLDGLSFSVERGETLCIVGPSGTGKSVTLKHLVRLLTPSAGTVTIDGTDVAACDDAALAALRARTGYLFQGGALLAWMTVAENVALPLRECTSLGEDEIGERVRAALESVGLADAAARYPAEISGGMQKRAALARVLVREAEIILYDEPTSGLDPVTSVAINGLIAKLARERGITSIVVTHDLPGALRIADRLLLLRNGRAVACLDPDSFVRSPDPEVREFLSAMKGELS